MTPKPEPKPAAPAAAPVPAPGKPAGSSVLAAPPALAPAAKPEPAKPAPAAVPAPAPKPAPTVEAPKPAVPAPAPAAPPAAAKPLPAPAPAVAAVAPVAKPESKPEAAIVAPAAAPAAPAAPKPEVPAPPPAASTPASEAAPATTTPTAPEPAKAPQTPAPAPAQSQSVPESEESGGLVDLLSNWGLPIAGLVAVLIAALLLVRRMGARAGRSSGRSGRSRSAESGEGSRAGSFAAGTAAAAMAGNRMGDTLVTPPKPLDGPGALEQTQAITQQIAQPGDSGNASSNFDKTLVIEPDVAASLQMSATPSAVSQNKADFDMTTQLQAETLHINLDANDPISEADFHLAYGLYDEAILLLKQAAVKDPQRLDLRVKLAETYFAAGKPIEFQTLAEELKPKLDAGEWSKIAIMGSQLCPSVALFKSEGGSELAADFDLGFDDEPAPASAPAPASRVEDAPLAFELPDISIPAAAAQLLPEAAPKSAPAPAVSLDALNADIKLHMEPELSANPAPEEDPASIDFMLGQSITPIGAGSLGSAPSLDSNLLEFDLDASLNKPAPVDSGKPLPGVIDDLDFPLSVRAAEPPAAAMDDAARDMKLEEFSVSLTPRESAGNSADEFNTKLDLARAYVEMGDNEMARGLLQEVQQQGDEKQQREAGEMLQRLVA